MSLKHTGILLGKEFVHGPKGFIFVWAIVAPLLISGVFSLIFGNLFGEKPELGIVDEGSSQLVTLVEELDSVVYEEYDDAEDMKQAVESGAVDMGIVLPAGFDDTVIQGDRIEITAYTWGESLAKDRTIIQVTISDLLREMAGQEAPVEIETVTLGDKVTIPWGDRLLPLIVLMAVFLGGVFLPATSLMDEKEKKTLDAVVITPASIIDVFIAKGVLGLVLSLCMGILILVINQALGTQPLLLVLVMALGAVMAVELGLICGAVFKDVSTLFAVWKSAGIILFGPALVYMFPNWPQWIGKIFPTYYMLDPIMAITQRGSDWAGVATNVFILIGIDIVFAGLVLLTLKKKRQLAG
ncbi:ABC transporter permease [Chloroflexota bacterium]